MTKNLSSLPNFYGRLQPLSWLLSLLPVSRRRMLSQIAALAEQHNRLADAVLPRVTYEELLALQTVWDRDWPRDRLLTERDIEAAEDGLIDILKPENRNISGLKKPSQIHSS